MKHDTNMVIFFGLLLFLLFYSIYNSVKSFDYSHELTKDIQIQEDNPLDDCKYVFLDMGSNFGVQIRFAIIITEYIYRVPPKNRDEGGWL